jgi:hypothetical protein
MTAIRRTGFRSAGHATALCSTALAVIVLGGASCSRSDRPEDDNDVAALGALQVAEPSTRYAHEFWLDQARRHTTLWDSALAVCGPYWSHADGSKPNCGHVYTARFFNDGARAR